MCADSVLALAAADGYLLSGAIDQTIIVWDPAQDWAILQRLRAHSGHVLSIIGVPGHAVSTSDDGAMCVWDTKTWSLKTSFEVWEIPHSPPPPFSRHMLLSV